MDGHGVDRAAGARGHEALQPGQSHGRASVRDGGRDELGFPGKGLHVREPSGGGSGGAEVGLAGVVGLVEAEEGGGAGGDGFGGDGGPGADVVGLEAPEHGHVFETTGDGGGGGAPVVGPGYFGRGGEEVREGGVVVGYASLAGAG